MKIAHKSGNFINVVISAAISGYLLKGFSFLISLVTLPIVISNLGKVQYGIFILVGQTVSLLALTDIGVQNSIGRFISKYRASNNYEQTKYLTNTAIFILSIVGLIVIIITSVSVYWIPIWLKIDPEYYKITRLIFFINGLLLATLFPTRVGQGIIAGHQLYKFLNLIKIITPTIRLSGIIYLSAIHKLGLLELTLLISSSILMEQLIIIIIANKRTSLLPINFNYISKQMIKGILSLGSSGFLITISGILLGQGTIISVGIILGTSSAGIYGVVIMVITNISYILTKMGQPLVTIASELDILNKKEKLKNLTNIVMSVSFVISGLISAFLFYYCQPLLEMLIKKNWDQVDYQLASRAIVLMSFCITIGIPQFTSRAVLQGVGLHWKASLGKIVSSIISFTVGIILILLGFDIIGAAVGWGLTWVLQGLIYFPQLIMKYFNQSVLQLMYKVYLPGLAILGINISIGYLLNQILIEHNLINIFLSGFTMLAVSTIVFIIISNQINSNYQINKRSLVRLLANS